MFTWLVHLGDLAVIMLSCHLIRIICRWILPNRPRILAEEFISTMDFCGCCFELAFICETYGTVPFAIALFVCCYWWCRCWGDAAVNPNKHIEDYVRGTGKPIDVGLRILAELLAGKFVWNAVHYMWSFELSPDHSHKSHEIICEADLQIPAWKGAIVECVLTIIDRLNALSSEDITVLQNNVYLSLLSTSLVVSALNYSGGYFNPVLATSLKFGCRGHSTIEFFLVYWIGSIIGSLFALEFYLLVIHRICNRRKSVSVQDKKK